MRRKTRYKLPENSITRKAPVIAVQWNHELNERDNLSSPDDYTLGIGVKAWWWCGNPLHSPWKAAIGERTGDARHSSGCP